MPLGPLASWALCQHPLWRADEGESQGAGDSGREPQGWAAGPLIAPRKCVRGGAGEKGRGQGTQSVPLGGQAPASWVRGLGWWGRGQAHFSGLGAELLGKGTEWGPPGPAPRPEAPWADPSPWAGPGEGPKARPGPGPGEQGGGFGQAEAGAAAWGAGVGVGGWAACPGGGASTVLCPGGSAFGPPTTFQCL